MAVNYVKFYRGSPDAYKNLTKKNNDTLYFVYTSDSDKGTLYLGEKLIAGGINGLSDLEDILMSNLLEDGQLLSYDADQQKWINKSVLEAIGVMTGATSTEQGGSGLVPAPIIGADQLFLRGDGKWAAPSEVIQMKTDDTSVSTLEDGQTITLKDFGKKYYAYIPSTGTFGEVGYKEGYYTVQIVDEDHPWKEWLEPKVIREDGELVLGWFEPRPVDLDEITSDIEKLDTEVTNLRYDLSSANTVVASISQDVSTLKTDIVKKANSSEVYTKTETDTKISEAVSKIDHLKRKTFMALKDAIDFANSIENPETYIYMVYTVSDDLNDQYDEYMYIEGSLEKLGAWDVDLENYVTEDILTEALKNKVDVREGYDLVSDEDIEKLSSIEINAQENIIDAVDESVFNIENKTLKLLPLEISQIANLQDTLNFKAEKETVTTLENNITNLTNDLSLVNQKIDVMNSKVEDLESLLNQGDLYVLKSDYDADMEYIMDSITWKDMN